MLFYPYIKDEAMIDPTAEQARTPVYLSDCRIGDLIRLPTGRTHWQVTEHLPQYQQVELKGNAVSRQYPSDTLVYPVSYAGYPRSPRQEIKVVVIRDTSGKQLGVEVHQNGRIISPPFSYENMEKHYTETIFHDFVD